MKKHLVIYYGRSGSTLVDHYVSRSLCSKEFWFSEHGFPSSEIHHDELLIYYKKLMKLNETNIDWCMKYHISSGMTARPLKNKMYDFSLEGTKIFFEDLGITDLHFSFRMDMLDTIYSHMIAERDNTWVMTDGEMGVHKKRYYEKDYAHKTCHAYNKSYFLYNEYVKEFSNNFNVSFYPYENLNSIFDINNDPRGMKKQLTKEQKIDLIWNYDEIELIAKEFPFYHGKINSKNGVLET